MLGLMQGNTLWFCQHWCLLEPVKGFNMRLLFFLSSVSVESSTSSGLKSPRAADVTLSMTITEAVSGVLNLNPVKGHSTLPVPLRG